MDDINSELFIGLSRGQVLEMVYRLASALAAMDDDKNQIFNYLSKNIGENKEIETERKAVSILNYLIDLPLESLGDRYEESLSKAMFEKSDVFTQRCIEVSRRYGKKDADEARTFLLTSVDAKFRHAFKSWWAPFNRAWQANQQDEFVAVALKSKAASSGPDAGKTGLTAALAQYEAGTGKKGY